MTDRISVTKSVPTTSFYLEADRIGQSIAGNYTTVRFYLRCVNAGNTASYSSPAGQQIGSIDGIGTFGSHSATPFLPSGVATGATRWRDGPWDVNIAHNPDGTRGAVTLRQGLYYDGVSQDDIASFNDFPAIARGPHVEQGGAWQQAIVYAEQGAVWQQCLMYTEQAGAWDLVQ